MQVHAVHRAAALALLALPLVAHAAEPKTPATPSTGREAPRPPAPPKLSPEEGRALVDRTLAAFAQPKHDCKLILRNLFTAFANGIDVDLDAKTVPVYRAAVVCGAETERWLIVSQVMESLLKVDPTFPRPSLLPISKLALGDFAAALETGAAQAKLHPDDGEIVLARASAFCHTDRWRECQAEVEKARALIKPGDPWHLAKRSRSTMAEALFHQGQLDASTAELQAVESNDPNLVKRLKRNEIVKLSKLSVEPEYEKNIPIGVYHLLGKSKLVQPLVSLKLYNFGEVSRQVRIEVQLPGVTEAVTTSTMLLKGKGERVAVTPPLRGDFNLAAMRAERPASLSIRVSAKNGSGGDEVLYEKAYPVTLLPRDSLPLSQRQRADVLFPMPELIAAWITPNARSIDTFLTVAKQRVKGPFAGMFTGVQHASLPQVKALWDELQAQGVSYVSDPEVLGDFGHVQRTRLPADVLESKNAQCLEGTILFATLMEAIGLKPVIVKVPGHAFVGWHPASEDQAAAGALYFIETTAVHSLPFEQAMMVAKNRVVAEEKAGHFKRGKSGPSFMLDLAELRRQGIRPQPLD